ncbi:protein LTO1 homolog isoform X2 [Halichondria panicea]|uniref:protein LTO1 homolog isoform X2 n=1 Tax=Halichondria panicea TaxID=6063 RepID=UPI00312B376A
MSRWIRLYKEGYAEGLAVGKEQGRNDGFSTGRSTGRELGEELGYYLGFTETILSTVVKEEKNERKLRLLNSLLELVKDFHHLNTSSADYQLNLTRVRAKFSQVLSLLQVSQSLHPHRQSSSLNF